MLRENKTTKHDPKQKSIDIKGTQEIIVPQIRIPNRKIQIQQDQTAL